MMDICVGLVGRKSENVKKPLVLFVFFEGSKRQWERVVGLSGFGSESARYSDMLRGEDIGGVQRIII